MCSLAFSSLLASDAGAGPWPREAGSWFVSGTVGVETLASQRRPAAEIYVERGLRDRLVLGAHLRRAKGYGWWDRPTETRGDVFLRWHPDLPGATAVGFTAGLRRSAGGGRPLAPLLAAHVGRGMETPLGNIWARADLQAVADRDGLGGRATLEITGQFGLRTNWGAIGILTLSEFHDRENRILKLIPALGYAVTPRSTAVLGATFLPRERQVDGLQISVWFDH